MFGTNFGTLDWLIVIVYLVATGVVGIYVNRYIHNVGDYMVGGRAAGTSLNVDPDRHRPGPGDGDVRLHRRI